MIFVNLKIKKKEKWVVCDTFFLAGNIKILFHRSFAGELGGPTGETGPTGPGQIANYFNTYTGAFLVSGIGLSFPLLNFEGVGWTSGSDTTVICDVAGVYLFTYSVLVEGSTTSTALSLYLRKNGSIDLIPISFISIPLTSSNVHLLITKSCPIQVTAGDVFQLIGSSDSGTITTTSTSLNAVRVGD